MKKYTLFIVRILCLLFSFAQAQSPQVVHFLGKGYPYNSSFVMNGNDIWTITANALIKVDALSGTQTIYKPDNSNMKGAELTDLVVDTLSNKVYCSTFNRGFYAFDGTQFSIYDTLTSGEKMFGMANLQIDANQNVWFISSFMYNGVVSQNDIVKFDGNGLSRLNCPTSPMAYSVKNDFVITYNGHIFFTSQSNKIYHFNGIQWDSLPSPSVDAMKLVEDNNHQVWLVPMSFQASTTSYHFYKWMGSTWQNVNVNFSTPVNDYVNEVITDNTGTMWFSCMNRVIKKVSASLYILNNTPPLNAVPDLGGYWGCQVAKNGDIWCLFKFYNFYFSENKLLHYDNVWGVWNPIPIHSDFEHFVENVVVDNWNRKWAVSKNYLYQLIGNNWQRIALPPNHARIYDPYNSPRFDNKGNLWVVMEDSVSNQTAIYKYDGTNWSLFYTIGIGGGDIAIDSNGNMGLALQQYIIYFDGFNNYTWYIDPIGISPTFPFPVNGYVTNVVCSNDIFYFYTDQGEFFKCVGTNLSLITNSIFTQGGGGIMSVDKANNVWINPLQNQLYRFDGNNFTVFDTSNMPFSGNYLGLQNGTTDLAGNTWISSGWGLAKHNGTNWTIFDYNNSDIIQTGSLSTINVDNANNLWFVDGLGVSVFNESGVSNNFTQTIQPLFKGNIFYDNNGNGTKNANDYGISNQKINISPTNDMYLSNGIGNYQYPSNAGNYNISPLLAPNWQQTSTPINYTVSANPQGIDSLNFGLKMTTNIDSLELHIFGEHSRCNWYNTYFISYQNKGSSVLSGDIIFTMDLLETFVSASQTADSLSPFTYSWHFSNLQPFQSQNISVTVQSPNWQAMGQTINGNVHAVGTNFNVTTFYSDILTCAYDPNDKTSKPLGEHYLHQIKPDCPLEYLIRFQNTGNDVAFNIAVEDTISPYLDMNTFELLGASHFVETKYTQNGAVRFEFPLIMLPDSNQNEALSHGFVAYRIKPKANVPLPAVIENTAFIYFDQNPAVVTNTARDTMTQFYTGINAPSPQNTLLISPNPFDNQTIVSYPNPLGEGCEVLIYDLSGKLLLRKMDNTGHFSIEKGNLQSGMYLLKVKGRKEMSAKLIVQ